MQSALSKHSAAGVSLQTLMLSRGKRNRFLQFGSFIGVVVSGGQKATTIASVCVFDGEEILSDA
jgi:hypothetical protein